MDNELERINHKYICKKWTSVSMREADAKASSCKVCPHLLSFRLLPRNVKIKIYKTIILPVVLYGRETWSLTLREEHRLSVWEQGAYENIWTSDGGSDGRLEKTAYEGLHTHSSPNRPIIRVIISRMMRWAGHVARMEEMRNGHKILVGKPEG
jgi:hypothetical protein